MPSKRKTIEELHKLDIDFWQLEAAEVAEEAEKAGNQAILKEATDKMMDSGLTPEIVFDLWRKLDSGKSG